MDDETRLPAVGTGLGQMLDENFAVAAELQLAIAAGPAVGFAADASARITIDSAGRSFTEPAGLLPSSLARITLLRPALMRLRRTSGVRPT